MVAQTAELVNGQILVQKQVATPRHVQLVNIQQKLTLLQVQMDAKTVDSVNILAQDQRRAAMIKHVP